MRQAKKRSQRSKSKKKTANKMKASRNIKTFLDVDPEKGLAMNLSKNKFSPTNDDMLIFKENPLISQADWNELYWGDFDVFPHKHIVLNKRNQECAETLFQSISKTAYTFCEALDKTLTLFQVGAAIHYHKKDGGTLENFQPPQSFLELSWAQKESCNKSEEDFIKQTQEVAEKIQHLTFTPIKGGKVIAAEMLPWADKKMPVSDYQKSIHLCFLALQTLALQAKESNRTYGALSQNLYAAQNIIRRIKHTYQLLMKETGLWVTEKTGMEWFDNLPSPIPNNSKSQIKNLFHSAFVYTHQTLTDYELYKKATTQAAQRLHMSLSSTLDSSVSNNYDLWNWAYTDYFIDMYIPSVAEDYKGRSVKHPRGIDKPTDWFLPSFLEQSQKGIYQGYLTLNKSYLPSLDGKEGFFPLRIGMMIASHLSDTNHSYFVKAWNKTLGNAIKSNIQYYDPQLSKPKRRRVMEKVKKSGEFNLSAHTIYRVYELDQNLYTGNLTNFYDELLENFTFMEAA